MDNINIEEVLEMAYCHAEYGCHSEYITEECKDCSQYAVDYMDIIERIKEKEVDNV